MISIGAEGLVLLSALLILENGNNILFKGLSNSDNPVPGFFAVPVSGFCPQ